MNRNIFIACSIAVVIAYVTHGCFAANPISPFYPRIDVGGRCTNNSNCTVPHTVCNNLTKICQCDKGYEFLPNTKKCLIKLNATCNTADRTCDRPGSICKNKVCVCDENSYVMSLNRTWCLKLMPCKSASSCIGSNVDCIKGMCQCTKGAVMTAEGCKKPIDTINADCKPKTDICTDGDGNHDRVECLNGKCHCKSKYTPDKEKKRCVSRASSTAITSAALFILTAILSFRP